MFARIRRTAVVLVATLAMGAAAVALATPAQAAPATSGVHRIWISVDSMTTSTKDDALAVPTDRASALAFVASLNDYWTHETNGAVTIALGGFEVRAVTSSCSVSSLFSRAPAVDFGGQFATTSSWSGTNNHLLAMTREPCSTSSVGQGTVGGGGGIMASAVGTAGDWGLAVAAHEFGHNLGFLHANVDSCPTGTDSGPTCATTPYTDYLDVMGGAVAGSLPHVSTPQLISLGYLTDYASLSQTYGIVQQRLMPVGAGSGTRSVRITDPATGEQYYVEYRIADAADAASPEFGPNLSCTTAANGLTRCWGGMSTALGGIRVLRVGPDGTSVLGVGAYGSTHLDLGQSFENHDGAFRVDVSALSPTAGATLTIAFGASITPTAAAVTTTPTATATPTGAVVDAAVAPSAAPSAAIPTLAVPKLVWSTMHVAAHLRHSTIRRGTHPVVVAVVTGAARPTGSVTVWGNGHKLRTVPLRSTDKGIRAITLPKRTAAGKLVIRVTYAGGRGLTAAASGTKHLRVR